MDYLDQYLRYMAEHNATDLYLTAHATPQAKIDGQMIEIDSKVLINDELIIIAKSIMNKDQQAEFEAQQEINLALSKPELGRFRINIFQQRNSVAIVARYIRAEIPSLEQLRLPPKLSDLVMEKRGLLIVVGATGSGKSTTIASLIDYRNTHSAGHIITIEDPIEFMHKHKKSIVNQREVGIDTHSYKVALENTLRQAPDLVLIGEIRTEDTMDKAIQFSETGHLCISTLHANNANQALDRIINFFPEDHHHQIRLDLSLNLRAIISQRLIRSVENKYIVAVEIMLNTPLVSELIRRGDVPAIKEVIEKSESIGMQSFDSALFRLYFDKKITLQDALRNADSANNLRLKIKLAESGVDEKQASQLSLEKDEEEPSDTDDPDKKEGNADF